MRGEWNRLNSDSPQASLFRTWEWAFHWWTVFLQERSCSLKILAFRDPRGRLVAVIPLHDAKNPFDKLWARRLSLLQDFGWHQEQMVEEPTSVIALGYETLVIEALSWFLSCSQHFRWDACQIGFHSAHPAERSERVIWKLKSPLVAWQCKQHPGSRFVLLPPDWATYRGSLSRSMRDNLSYYPRKDACAGLALRVRILTSLEDVA